MSPSDRALLAALAKLQRELAVIPRTVIRSAGRYAARLSQAADAHRRDGERAHGPRVVRLYGCGYDDAARKRVSRALDRLAAAGLVTLWRAWGKNVTHAKLTAAGEALVGESEG